MPRQTLPPGALRTNNRLALIDALKAIASQLIVLHHLAFYGPMSDTANELAPELFAWLSQHARIAVQVFLVIGGYLAARALAPQGFLTDFHPLQLLRKRYLKLTLPFAGALILSIACAAIARHLMQHESIPMRPAWSQLFAHLALLHSILNVESLSTGVWYIAIDFQLFALLLALLWAAQRLTPFRTLSRPLGACLVTALVLMSLFVFNRDASLDIWGVYFFGAYGLGALTFWAARARNRMAWSTLLMAATIVALSVDFRTRIAVAALTALAIGSADVRGFANTFPKGALFAYLGKISYSVFLSHFPVVLIVNALVHRFAPNDPAINAAGVIVAWLASIGVGALFYHGVESRASRALERVTLLFARIGRRLRPALR